MLHQISSLVQASHRLLQVPVRLPDRLHRQAQAALEGQPRAHRTDGRLPHHCASHLQLIVIILYRVTHQDGKNLPLP